MLSPAFYLRRPSLDETPDEVVEILLIEDSAPDAELVIELLADEVGPGAHFTHVTRLDAALQLLDAHDFNIALADLSLPDAVGLEIVTSLQVAAPHLPIIVLSGSADIDNAVRSVHAGAQDYLLKGRLDGNQVLRAMRYAIERKGVADELQQLLGTLELRVATRTAALKAANGQLRSEIAERQAAATALRTSEAKYRELTELASDAIFISDQQGNFIETNQSATNLLGYSREEMLLLNVRDITIRADPDALPVMLAAAQSGKSVLQVGVLRRKDGSSVQTETNARMMADGGIQAIVRDCTERTRLDQEQQSRLAAERAYRAKSEFLARMSHELLTPLNAILGFGQLLEMDDLPPEQQESVGYIMQAGKHLLELVDKLLDISKLEKGLTILKLEAVPIQEFLLASIFGITPNSVREGVSMQAELAAVEGLAVRADRARLGTVVLNLLTNAIAYNHNGGNVVVSAAQVDGSDKLRINITDSGPGIAADKIGRLFMPFERLDDESDGVQGTGLGLVLAKLLIEEMSGKIGVLSEVAKGTTFWIELPLAGESDVQQL